MAFRFMKNDFHSASFVWLFLLAISIAFICANSEDMTEPRRNDNMNPTQGWRSAAECMFNKSKNCTDEQQLSLNVTIVVSEDEAVAYCQNGCLVHTLAVLDCIRDVKRDFWFTNNFNTWTVRRFITDKCSSPSPSGFSYKDIPSS